MFNFLIDSCTLKKIDFLEIFPPNGRYIRFESYTPGKFLIYLDFPTPDASDLIILKLFRLSFNLKY